MPASQHSELQHPSSAKQRGEDGFMLMAVVVMVALVLIALAVAAPVVARDLRRDKEVESKYRAQQYVRAIRLYQRKFPNQYPPSLEALEKSNNIRFLRKQYEDPLTGKADWRIIHVGENKTTVKGFFGEPLGGLNTTGAGGSGLGSAAGMASGGSPGTPSGTTTVGTTNALASGFSGATVATPGTSGTAGTSAGATGSSGTSGSGTSGLGSSGGVGPIMGVGSSRSGASLLAPNDQSTYDTWEFLYDPRIEAMYNKGALNGGVGSQSASSFGQGLSGQSNSSSGSGTSSPGGSGTGTGAGTGTGGTTSTPR